MVTTEVRLSSKHQVVVPEHARAALGVVAGDTLLLVTVGTQVIVLKKPTSSADATRGMAAGVYPDGYLDSERDDW